MSRVPRIETNVTQVAHAQTPLWLGAMTLIRSSIIFLYLRIFPMRWFRVTCYSVLIFNTVFFVAALLSLFLGFFLGGSQNDKALDWIDPLTLIFNLVLDVVIVILPIPTLWGLQVPISKKIMLSGMFSLGLL